MSLPTLPLFPLPLVLFPGAALPLHVFEQRYRRMLADCLDGDGRFGIVFLPAGSAEDELERGRVGCVAHIDAAVPLPDGRSNIIVAGIERFALEAIVATDAPYHVGTIHPYGDVPEPAATLAEPATRLRQKFERVTRATRTLDDDRSPSPTVPDDPRLLAFAIAAMIDLDSERRQLLLEMRSPAERLQWMTALLDRAIEPIEQRAEIHTRAKTNGRGPGAH